MSIRVCEQKVVLSLLYLVLRRCHDTKSAVRRSKTRAHACLAERFPRRLMRLNYSDPNTKFQFWPAGDVLAGFLATTETAAVLFLWNAPRLCIILVLVSVTG